jgi:hypothetical protein
MKNLISFVKHLEIQQTAENVAKCYFLENAQQVKG